MNYIDYKKIKSRLRNQNYSSVEQMRSDIISYTRNMWKSSNEESIKDTEDKLETNKLSKVNVYICTGEYDQCLILAKNEKEAEDKFRDLHKRINPEEGVEVILYE